MRHFAWIIIVIYDGNYFSNGFNAWGEMNVDMHAKIPFSRFLGRNHSYTDPFSHVSHVWF